MAEYVERYSERVQDVPTTLHRLFKLIRELDERSVALQSSIDGKCKELLQSAAATRGRGGRELPSSKRQKVDTTTLSAEIDAGMQKVISLAEEKLKIASQVYDFIDAHIRDLDTDLSTFRNELSEDRSKLGLNGDTTARDALGLPSLAPPTKQEQQKQQQGAATAGAPGGRGQKKRGPGRRRAVAVEEPAEESEDAGGAEGGVPLMDVSAEPRYCYCNRVSFGDMIACDNPDCVVEWFHFGCVGVTKQPKTKWYCPDCAAALGKGAGKAGRGKG